jgi:predicted phosphoribosyltransferase/dienelactone hydrolase
MRLYENRLEAAKELAEHLAYLKERDPVVVGIPNNGVPVAEVIARELEAPLDILLIRKLSPPRHADQVVGAVDEHGRISLIQSAARWHHMTSQQLIKPARSAFRELQAARDRFRADLPEVNVRGRTVILVDEGVFTGATMLAGISSLRDRGAAKVICTAPAGANKAIWQLHDAADGVVIPHTPTTFKGIDHFYRHYQEPTDELVAVILNRWVHSRPSDPDVRTIVMRLESERGTLLSCELDLPPGMVRGSGPYPAVIFSHGIESDGQSARSLPISRRLAKRGIVGARIDFSGHGRSEGQVGDATDNVMISDLTTLVENLKILDEIDDRCVGVIGAGTGGRIALRFAAEQKDIAALVIRGPVCGDEVHAAANVEAPTLLIHAERDNELRASVDEIDNLLHSTHRLLTIPDCDRLFNDPISRELMISASVEWMDDHIRVPQSR